MKNTKIGLALILTFKMLIVTAQDRVINQTNSCRLLHIRPNMVFGISPTSGDFMVQLNLDAQYWYKEKMDLRLSSLSGTFTGLSIGGTYHLKDRFVSKSTKFTVSETTQGNRKITEYYKRESQYRKVFGPSGDVKFAFIDYEKEKTSNPFIEIRGGLDYQTFSRNYFLKGSESYPSNKNGWFSIKALGVLQYFKGGTKTNIQFGALGSLTAVKSPWRSVSFNLNMDLGVTFGSAGVLPIISPGFGLSINLFKSKKEIEY